MSSETVEFFYDYVDPASYLMDRILARLGDRFAARLVPRPFELRRPPAPLVDPGSPEWRAYVRRMREEARRLEVELNPPELVPWSRKAHEVALLARERGVFPELHRRLFRAYFVEGRDPGRVDVLVELATEIGMDRTETKAVLDVDRHAARVEEERSRAERLGVQGVPTLLAGERRLEGFRPEEEVLTFLEQTIDES